MKIILLTLSIILVIAIAIGCSKRSGVTTDVTPPPPPVQINCNEVNAQFSTDMLPIVQTKCATGSNCHGDGSFSGPGALTSFTKIKNAASQIKAAVNSGRMPLAGSLTTDELKKINCWVDNGALNN